MASGRRTYQATRRECTAPKAGSLGQTGWATEKVPPPAVRPPNEKQTRPVRGREGGASSSGGGKSEAWKETKRRRPVAKKKRSEKETEGAEEEEEECCICFDPLLPSMAAAGADGSGRGEATWVLGCCKNSIHTRCLDEVARKAARDSAPTRAGVLIVCPRCQVPMRWPLPAV